MENVYNQTVNAYKEYVGKNGEERVGLPLFLRVIFYNKMK